MKPGELAAQLVDDIKAFRWDPVGFIDYALPWNSQDVSGSAGPRSWQRQVLQTIGDHLQNPLTRHQPCNIAVSSGHGIGKSSLISMLIAWAMSTSADTRVVITSNTEGQLRTKSWPEINKWCRLLINASWFNLGATSVTAKAKGHERLWRTDAISWSENNVEAFHGLHNLGKRILLVMDEASSISDRIYEVSEGALTDKDTEIIWIVCGNPTLNTGRFRECFGKFKHRWKTFQIDSRNVEGTNLALFEQWAQDYGEDSDFFRVRVKGEFPRASSAQFIPNDVVAACRRYKAESYKHMPKIISCDVARYGANQTVVVMRQGRKIEILGKYRNLDTVATAERILQFKEQHQPNAIIIDADGIGAGVVDQLASRGLSRGLFEFHGGLPAHDSAMYFNRRAEVWGLMRDALKANIELPDDPEIEVDLCSPQYGFSNKGQIQLEKKEDMVRRGLASPDIADAIAYSFAERILAAVHPVVSNPCQYSPGEGGQRWMMR